ncbi:hypothetical protein FACS1894182_01630 [Bacteroidia bacterium]|nr:hypothetical protein FACS1894182_01630 [Bacteroidia bacterium]
MKQRIGFLVLFLVLLVAVSCTKKMYPDLSAEVTYLSGDEQTVTVRAVGVGNSDNQAFINAEQKVFDVLFFRGLPESVQKLPLVSNDESGEMKKHKNYFDEFYNGGRYKTFVMSSIPTSNTVKLQGGQKMVTVDLRVNLWALRRDLETFNVIRKFGY